MHCAFGTWRSCLRGQLATRSTPRRWPRLLAQTPRQVGSCGFGPSWPSLSSPVARGARTRRPVANHPTAHNARTERCVLGAVVCTANSQRAPPHAVNRSFLVSWRSARARFAPWRTSRPPTDHALRAADLAWLSLRPTRGALHLTPLAEAHLHRHRARSAVAALDCGIRSVLVPWRAPPARFDPW